MDPAPAAPSPAPTRPPPRTWLVAVGLALWVVVTMWNWPVALSFGDEVGYVGQARLFLEGRIRPTIESPGIWHTTASGALIAKYPLFHSALLAPFIAIAPRSAFLLGIAAAATLVVCAAHLLRQWGKDPAWALLLLAQPAITLVSRTLMADLLLSTFLFGAYLSMRANRHWVTVVLLASTLLAKPTGVILAALLVGGDVISMRRQLLSRQAPAIRRLASAAVGMGAGLVLVVITNFVANGTPWFGYHERFGAPTFESKFFFTAGVAHLKSLLLAPPLVLVGIVPYWRRRDFGPVAVIVGLVGLMSIYYFVDWGRNWTDSLVLSQRLILPAIVFLMIGYVDLLDDLVARGERIAGHWFRLLCVAGLVILPAVAGQAIGARHRRWQEPMRAAIVAVAEVAKSVGTDHIALTQNALKYGLLFRGKTSMYVANHADPVVVLCATKTTSYRILETDAACIIPEYRMVRSVPGSDILVRSDKVSRR